MVEVYVLIEKKKSILKTFIAWLCFCMALACIVLSCSMYSFFVIGVVLAIVWYWLFFMSGIEYEYSYFDGDLRFAKVIGKRRRKSLGSYSIEDVVQIAPAGDRSVYKYENDSNVSVKDYTSGKSEVPYYDIILKDNTNNKYAMIKAELDDKYLDSVCYKYASKVIRRAGE